MSDGGRLDVVLMKLILIRSTMWKTDVRHLIHGDDVTIENSPVGHGEAYTRVSDGLESCGPDCSSWSCLAEAG